MDAPHKPKSTGRMAPQPKIAPRESGTSRMTAAKSVLDVGAGCWSFARVPVFFFLGLATPAVALGAESQPPPGFVTLFNGRDFSGWTVPVGDNGHWKVLDGVIDYDAQSEAKADKSLWTEREFGDFVLQVDWRIKEAPYVNPNVYYILPDGTHARDIHGKELKLALPDSDSGILLRGSGKYQVNIWCWRSVPARCMASAWTQRCRRNCGPRPRPALRRTSRWASGTILKSPCAATASL
jgi:hypothetical protein